MFAASSSGSSGTLPLKQPAASTGGTSGPDLSVSQDTWALVCAGQFSLLAPAFAASAANGAGHGAGVASRATATSLGSQLTKMRCSGVSLRLDTVGKKESSYSRVPEPQAREAASNNTDDNIAGLDEQKALPSLKEFTEAWIRGMEAVAGRAGSIVLQGGAAGLDPGPRRLATNTAHTAGRICRQAVKIARRSVEQVGRLATRPFNGWGSPGDSGSSTKPPPGGG